MREPATPPPKITTRSSFCFLISPFVAFFHCNVNKCYFPLYYYYYNNSSFLNIKKKNNFFSFRLKEEIEEDPNLF
jgi:hypothetical protein